MPKILDTQKNEMVDLDADQAQADGSSAKDETVSEPKAPKKERGKGAARAKQQEPTMNGALQQEAERVSAKQAAIAALKRAHGPLKSSEIAKRVLDTPGVVGLKGKTPVATIGAQLYLEAKKPDGEVVLVEKGTFDLRERQEAKTGS